MQNQIRILCLACFVHDLRTCIHNIFAMKNVINHQLFKEKIQVDGHSIKQVFDAEKQDLAPKL